MEREQIETLVAGGVDSVAAVIATFEARIAALEAEMSELRARLDKSSRNSSKPPSSDGYSKLPAKPKSLRKRSGRKPGGQPGSPGHHLAVADEPDEVIVHVPDDCAGCGRELAAAEVTGSERRQVFDLPPPAGLWVSEHRAERRRCECGCETAAAFPDGVGAPTQYGPWVRAYAIYLICHQHLPYLRAARLLGDLFAAPISTGTLAAIVSRGADGLEPFIAAVRSQLGGSAVLNLDETGARIEGRLRWVHSASSEDLTLYGAHERRGVEGIDALGVLPGFTGVAVHDGWTPYGRYEQASHALCGAHHLRELQGVIDAGGERQSWAAEMAALLREANEATTEARARGEARLDPETPAAIEDRYTQILATGHAENPEPEPTGRRGRPTRSTALNLLRRLDSQRDQVLRFARDLRVPFDNNLAERDLRMVKLQQKISGSWRTIAGARAFLAYRSYLSSGRKQGKNPLDLMRRLLAGDPWIPVAEP